MSRSKHTEAKHTQAQQRKRTPKPVELPPKEEVGRWESEGGAPQGGRNPTAIHEGQDHVGPASETQSTLPAGSRQRKRQAR